MPKRKGMTLETVERWLGPNLNYEAEEPMPTDAPQLAMTSS